MARFHNLKVTDIQKDTRHAVIITLQPEAEDADKFKFIQGQYLTFKKAFEGEEIRRSYSICSGVNDNKLRVGIKHVEGGWFSSWANSDLEVGDTLEAMPPNGRFYGALEPELAKTYLAFAAGSGITPMISLIKTILEAEPLSKMTLVYANRSVNMIMFKEELFDIKNTYMERFVMLNVLDQSAEGIEILNGPLMAEQCDRLFTTWVDPSAADMAFICGPEAMMLTVSDRLAAHGLAKENIKFELFKSTPTKKRRKVSAVDLANQKTVKATIIIDGTQSQFDMPAKDVSILDAAMEQNMDIPYSCQAGVCSTCSAKVVSGEVEMLVNHGLEDYEVQRGLVLTCQAYPISDEVVLDYDQH